MTKYPSDGAGHNNLAIAYFGTLNFTKALEEGRRVMAIYPNSPMYRSNYALYAMYAGDFATAEAEGRKMAEEGDFLAFLPVAMAALAGGRVADAAKAWEGAKATGAQGESLAAMGLADLALRRKGGGATPRDCSDRASQPTSRTRTRSAPARRKSRSQKPSGRSAAARRRSTPCRAR